MAEYMTFQVEIVVEEGSALYRRLQRTAETEGISMEEAVIRSVSWGVYHHMHNNLNLMERSRDKA